MKKQKLKAVILDTHVSTLARIKAPSEFNIRHPIENMRWDAVKIETIHDACKRYSSQSEISYYLPNIRYHERWENLEEVDFIAEEFALSNNFMGYPAHRKGGNKQKFYSLKTNELDFDETEPLDDYMKKIAQFCVEQGVKLVLVKTSTAAWNLKEQQFTRDFCQGK